MDTLPGRDEQQEHLEYIGRLTDAHRLSRER